MSACVVCFWHCLHHICRESLSEYESSVSNTMANRNLSQEKAAKQSHVEIELCIEDGYLSIFHASGTRKWPAHRRSPSLLNRWSGNHLEGDSSSITYHQQPVRIHCAPITDLKTPHTQRGLYGTARTHGGGNWGSTSRAQYELH